MSTMGWPWPEDYPETVGLLDSFNPTSVLTTAREIITLWVSRMVMFNRYFLDGQLPFDRRVHPRHDPGRPRPEDVEEPRQRRRPARHHPQPRRRRDALHAGADDHRHPGRADAGRPRLPPHAARRSRPSSSPRRPATSSPPRCRPRRATRPSRWSPPTAWPPGLVEPTDDLPLARNTSSKFDLGRNFANKLWNATRFALKRVDASRPGRADRSTSPSRPFADRWILARLTRPWSASSERSPTYQFNAFADTLYDFVWHDVCDRYLEMVKPTIDDDPDQQVVLGAVLDAVLRIMHPVCPFVTEALWPAVSAARRGHIDGLDLPPAPLLAGAAWPVVAAERLGDRDVIATFDRGDALAAMIRTLRAERNVAPRKR